MTDKTKVIVAYFIRQVAARANSFKTLNPIAAQLRALKELRPEVREALKAAGLSGDQLAEAMKAFE